MLYALFWVIPRRLNFICRSFGTLSLSSIFLHTYSPMKMKQTECFETSAYKIQTSGNYPKGSIQHSFNVFDIHEFDIHRTVHRILLQ